MRVPRITLSAKYRALFSLAVVLIIGAALGVPWVLVESLVDEQPYREAQRIADDYFRLVLPEPAEREVGGTHGPETSLLAARQHEVRFIREGPDAGEGLPAVAAAALERFRRNPKQEHEWARGSDGSRALYYAHAVRVTKSCLSCHSGALPAPQYQDGQLAGMILVALPAQASDALVTYSRLWLLGAGGLAGLLAVLVFYVITRQFILSPIHELREVAQRVAEGDVDVRSTVASGDEFEQLSRSLNTMLERIRAAQQELRRANKLLDQKLGEMAETNVALYEANRLKSEFLASVTHELRTPLTSIIGFAELLREGPDTDPSGRTARYSENILISARILLEIVNDLLDLAKIEANKVDLSLDAVRVDELGTTLVEFMRPLADKKNLTLGADIPADLPMLITDRGRLRQVLYNLLSNAIKFTPEGGSVRLLAQRLDDARVRIAVRDTGPGIPPENRHLIFEKFRQIDQSPTREHHGTGLGLAIARELTLLLGGEIGVDSTPGEGSTFWLILPVAISEPRPRPLVSLT